MFTINDIGKEEEALLKTMPTQGSIKQKDKFLKE